MKHETYTETLNHLVDAAMELASTKDWDKLTLLDLCHGSEVSLSQCASVGVTKAHVSSGLDARLDQAMLLANQKIEEGQSIRDRLFDVVMGRFDAMEESRTAWESILHGDRKDLASNLARRARRARTAAWALEATGISSSSFEGAAKALGLTQIIRACDGVWLSDGPDLAKTMAKLDQGLRDGELWRERASSFLSFVSGAIPKPKSAAEPTL
jgi:hypothetical protein